MAFARATLQVRERRTSPTTGSRTKGSVQRQWFLNRSPSACVCATGKIRGASTQTRSKCRRRSGSNHLRNPCVHVATRLFSVCHHGADESWRQIRRFAGTLKRVQCGNLSGIKAPTAAAARSMNGLYDATRHTIAHGQDRPAGGRGRASDTMLSSHFPHREIAKQACREVR